MKESDLFPVVKEWLEDRDYDVFTEVTSYSAGGRADVVAVNGPAVTVVEMKNSLTLDVIAQAARWALYTNYVYIAVRGSAKRRVSRYVSNLLQREGIGLLEVVFPEKSSYRGPYIYQSAKGRFHRRVDDHLRQELTPKHKELPGGHYGGGYVTPYSKTIDKVKKYLTVQAKGDWVSLDTILEYCETHWSSPKPSLSHSLRNFEYNWCESKKVGRKTVFRIKQK
ncbi:hypothetical protein [Paenibacillus glucanolyticus]|uniref:hypothetical protein n=1 Tax=Paenibacillus glucanolyticus TaxID=59843 RepID=UPI00096F1E7B|nr:hypothetical protein [Paenibacillus glucanolyticus]OMF76657.1 hypothetical protein BK142_14125 [Paenibacillus glucanolyticus]